MKIVSNLLKTISVVCFAMAFFIAMETMLPTDFEVITDAEFRRNMTIAVWFLIGGIIL